MSEQPVSITIGGKTHTFSVNDEAAIKDLAWQDRKQLIGLLEKIKQAEYIKKTEPPADANTQLPSVNVKPPNQPQSTTKTEDVTQLGQGDIDAMMSRLIIEEKKNQVQIPDKTTAIKWILLVTLIIIGLGALF